MWRKINEMLKMLQMLQIQVEFYDKTFSIDGNLQGIIIMNIPWRCSPVFNLAISSIPQHQVLPIFGKLTRKHSTLIAVFHNSANLLFNHYKLDIQFLVRNRLVADFFLYIQTDNTRYEYWMKFYYSKEPIHSPLFQIKYMSVCKSTLCCWW